MKTIKGWKHLNRVIKGTNATHKDALRATAEILMQIDKTTPALRRTWAVMLWYLEGK